MKAVAELRIVLDESDPKIYRRILVSHEITLHSLHSVIQAAMGWENKHRYYFAVDGARYEAGRDPENKKSRSSRRARLSSLPDDLSFFEYVYDTGDDWRHSIEILSVRSHPLYPRRQECVPARRLRWNL